MTQVMIDLETMGTQSNAPIISIGAVEFDRTGIISEFYSVIDLKSAVDGGAVMDPRTVIWWMEQSDEARAALTGSGEPIERVLDRFAVWMARFEAEGVWGNGAAFDNVILAEAYKRLDMEQPWPFWRDRCYRTLKSMYPDVTIMRAGTHHNALDDAKTQANHLIEIERQSNGRLF